ncbi:hypothetical protein TNCV_3118011 [Trichonephila clavipes]|uniref:Uncharacterized protein n=1 Tax=Trichonephila clavipes TaxID=2585209 RepID=A0A8X6W9E5_TRICX|nr:hypothetical protein TNCV_3118011 [Trichonephila clavipes]
MTGVKVVADRIGQNERRGKLLASIKVRNPARVPLNLPVLICGLSSVELILALFFGRPDCKNSPQSHLVIVYDAGLDESGVFHSAEWHDGDWSSDGIREAWLWFFIWGESFRVF